MKVGDIVKVAKRSREGIAGMPKHGMVYKIDAGGIVWVSFPRWERKTWGFCDEELKVMR